MAPWLFKEMKGVNFSCASPASAAICTSIDHKSMVRPSAGRAIDRHTPHLRDPRRAKAVVNSMSQAPTRSKPSYHQKSSRSVSLEEPAADELPVRTPASSARYLLNDDAFIDVFPDLEAAPSRLLAIQLDRPKEAKKEDGNSAAFQPCSSSVERHDQVVVLRVSLHCKGCEGKVRKHISRMEGVTSFNIDFSTKKVTVVGDVTPLGVLNSISKVKNAQLWPSTAAPPPSMPPQPPSSA